MRDTTQEQETITRFVEWGKGRDDVRAILMTSSRTTPLGRVDIFSDYDLIVIAADVHPFFDSRAWLEDFGRVLTLYRDPITIEDGFEKVGYVVQFEDGLKIDFWIWPVEAMQYTAAQVELPEEFDAGYRVLLDKDHLTDGLKAPTYKAYIPKPPSEAEYHEKIELFFLDAIYAAKFLWRDDLIAAKHMMDYYIKQDYLIPMLVWRSEIDHEWTVKPGVFGRGLKKWLRPDLWAELEDTYTGGGIEANWEALYRHIALFRKVALEVGDLLGYAYLHDLDRRASAYVQEVKDLSRDARG